MFISPFYYFFRVVFLVNVMTIAAAIGKQNPFKILFSFGLNINDKIVSYS